MDREASYDLGSLWNGRLIRSIEPDTTKLFNEIDKNGDGRVTREEFVSGLSNAPNVDLFEAEAGRLFDTIDSEGSGFVDCPQFLDAAVKNRWLRALIRLYIAGFEYHFTFQVDAAYDYTKSTSENYSGPPGIYSGPYAHIRATRDYSYHVNYTLERQQWQDSAVRASIGKTDPQARPWLVFTCGPYGAGKGHVLSWLSKQGLFPLEYIVHIDPDFFKRVMPEWKHYLTHNMSFAGTACHRESGYLQELAAEAALKERQNIWIDGSLRDHAWYTTYFHEIRSRFRHYKIAIIYVSASEENVRARIQRRGEETGRFIPEAEIISSLSDPEISISRLAPLCDLVVRIENNTTIKLLSVEDHSGNWHRGLYRHFGVISRQHLPFPAGLGPLYLENTAIHGHPFRMITKTISYSAFYPEFEGTLFVKESSSSMWSYCFVKLKDRRISCYEIDEGADSDLSKDAKAKWSVEISAKTSVKIYPEFYFINDSLKRDCRGALLQNAACSDNRRYSFYINMQDGERVMFLEFATSMEIACSSWKQHIDLTKAEAKREKEYSMFGSDLNQLVEWRLNYSAVMQLQNICKLVALKGLNAISMKSTAPCALEANQSLTNIPERATHFRWFYPNYELKNSNLGADIDLDDPDIVFLLSGGFAFYDEAGEIICATSLATRDTEFFVHFDEPQRLNADDANRLHSGGRWMPTTVEKLRSVGALYFTFIHPSERLFSPTPFPPYGSFAYLFRDPTDPPDMRDRYFPVLPIE